MIKRIGIFLIVIFFLAPTSTFASVGAGAAQNQTAEQSAAQAATVAAAGGGGGVSLNPVNWVIDAIVNGATHIVFSLIDGAIGLIVKVFVFLANKLVEWAIAINLTITQPGSLAYFGWGLTLNFANLLFVLAIVVIAFGIMFRRAWAKKSLPKLIIIALLINFSFFIAKELIAISDSITSVFLNTGAINLGDFADFFTGGGGKVVQGSAGSTLGKDAAELLSPISAAAFGFIAFLTLLSIAVAFIIRYVSLTILLILLPLALGMSLFSIKVGKMPNAWQAWQDNFLKWLLFGPAMSFFVYLSFQLLGYKQVSSEGGFIQMFGSAMGNNIIIIGILLGGLMVANKMGVAGAATFDGYIKKGQAWGEGIARGGARSMANRVLTAGARPGVAGGAAPTPSHAQRLSNRLIGVPGLRGVAADISVATQGIGKSVTETQEKFKSYDKDTFLRLVETTKFADPAKKAAFAMELAKRNLTNEIDPSKLDELLKSAAQVSRADPTGTSTKTILANRPDLATSFGVSIADAMKRITEPDKISPVSFNSSEVVLNLSNANLERLAKAGTDEQRNIIKSALAKISDDIDMKLVNYRPHYTPQQQQAHTRISEFVTANINWK